jgi:3-oxoadipate enol-lactonase
MVAASGYVEVNGARLWYETAGDGDALLLLHAGICDASMWDEHMEPLSAHFRVIRYDMRGLGRSNLPDGPFAAHDDARALLASLGVGRAHIVGVSMGGTVALNLALTYPDCVSALILVSTTVGGFTYAGPPSWVDELRAQIEAADAAGDVDLLNELEVRKWVDGAGRTSDQVDRSMRTRVLAMNRHNIELENPLAMPIGLTPPAVERLGEVHVPTLVIAGERDVPSTRASCALLATSISSARLVDVAGTAHLPCMERPVEFDAHVLGFL